MNPRRMTLLAWTLFGLIAVTVAAGVIFLLVNKPAEGEFSPNSLIDPFVTVGFAFVGALIISRQPRNVIGWLMMLPGLSFTPLVNAYLEPFLNDSFIPPESPVPIFLLILWFSNLNWMMWLFPTLFIMVLFTPLRIRIQDFIDRRFYHQKYDAERALIIICMQLYSKSIPLYSIVRDRLDYHLKWEAELAQAYFVVAPGNEIYILKLT